MMKYAKAASVLLSNGKRKRTSLTVPKQTKRILDGGDPSEISLERLNVIAGPSKKEDGTPSIFDDEFLLPSFDEMYDPREIKIRDNAPSPENDIVDLTMEKSSCSTLKPGCTLKELVSIKGNSVGFIDRDEFYMMISHMSMSDQKQALLWKKKKMNCFYAKMTTLKRQQYADALESFVSNLTNLHILTPELHQSAMSILSSKPIPKYKKKSF
jgi:hypothetical protein